MTPLRPRLPKALRGLRLLPILLLPVCLAGPALALNSYLETDLVSDVAGAALRTDPNLVNAWGLSRSATGPWWVSDAGTNLTTLYNGAGVPQPLVVHIPGHGPTGQVFNPTTDFILSNGTKATFLFVNLDGTVSGWNGAAGTSALAMHFSTGAYTGLALGSVGAANYLYAANFATGHIDVLDHNFNPAFLPGAFIDPTLPAGYAPFNVQNIGGNLYVAYATGLASPGNGLLDEFDTNGNFVRRIATGGTLNSPWGLAVAPGDFGDFSNDLLVGNFGDGLINAFDPATGTFLGNLEDPQGNAIHIDGLWGLEFGNGGNAGPASSLYFTSGPGGQLHGLFGSLAAVPEPGALALMALGLLGAAVAAKRRG